jgi:GT2 family glycosyltransferase
VCNNGHPSREYEEVYKKLPVGSVVKRNNTDGGFAVGANSAMNSGNAPLILFVTDDVFIHPGTIMKLVETMMDSSISQCGLKLLFPEDSTDQARPAGMVQHIGMATNIRGEMIHPLMSWNPNHPKCNVSREVIAVTGASFIIRREVFKRVGGFSLAYGKGYYEDVDLSLHIRSQGGKIWVNTEATATHGVGQTFKNEKTPIPIEQNRMIFMSRWKKDLVWTDWDVW